MYTFVFKVTFLEFDFLNSLYGYSTHLPNNCLGFLSSDHVDNAFINLTWCPRHLNDCHKYTPVLVQEQIFIKITVMRFPVLRICVYVFGTQSVKLSPFNRDSTAEKLF